MPRKPVPPNKRSRAGGKHSRTGCGTCKIRHVKCDEEKPTCQRCRQFGMVCDGYSAQPKLRKTRPGEEGTLLLPKPAATTQSIPVTPSSLLFESSDEHRHFTLFKDTTASDLVPYFESESWRKLISCTCNVLAIRHAVVAIAALNRIAKSPTVVGSSYKDPNHQHALEQYHIAIKAMRAESARGNQDLRTTLITCLLNTCFEAFHGNHDLAVTQIQTGVNIIRQWKAEYPYADQSKLFISSPDPGVIEDEILQFFGELYSAANASSHQRPQDMYEVSRNDGSMVQFNLPMAFGSVEEARAYLEMIVRRQQHAAYVAAAAQRDIMCAFFLETGLTSSRTPTPEPSPSQRSTSLAGSWTNPQPDQISTAFGPTTSWTDENLDPSLRSDSWQGDTSDDISSLWAEVMNPTTPLLSSYNSTPEPRSRSRQNSNYSEQQPNPNDFLSIPDPRNVFSRPPGSGPLSPPGPRMPNLLGRQKAQEKTAREQSQRKFELFRWLTSFNAFLDTYPMQRQSVPAMLLHLHFYSAYFALMSSGVLGDLKFDDFEFQMNEMVDLSERILQILHSPNIAHHPMGHDLGVIVPLYLIGLKCGVSSIREKAINLLLGYPRTEGIWDSAFAGKFTSWVRDLEEEFLEGETGRVPEWARVVEVQPKLDFEGRRAEVVCRQRIAPEGEWVERWGVVTW